MILLCFVEIVSLSEYEYKTTFALCIENVYSWASLLAVHEALIPTLRAVFYCWLSQARLLLQTVINVPTWVRRWVCSVNDPWLLRTPLHYPRTFPRIHSISQLLQDPQSERPLCPAAPGSVGRCSCPCAVEQITVSRVTTYPFHESHQQDWSSRKWYMPQSGAVGLIQG